MGLFLRGNIFWFTLKYEGKRYQGSLRTNDKRLAEKLYDKALTEIAEGKYLENIKAKETTFADMTKKYLKKYRKSRDDTSLKPLLPVFGNLALADITTEKISDYRHKRLKKVKPATLYQELALMRRMFNVARREWSGSNTIQSPISLSVLETATQETDG